MGIASLCSANDVVIAGSTSILQMIVANSIPSNIAEPRILRIVGDGRSGTTVIGTVLGQLPSAIFVGEVAQVWRAFTIPTWRCSCGESVASCSFWRDVRKQSQVDVKFDLDILRSTTEQCMRIRPMQLTNLVRRSLSPVLLNYAEALQCVYRAIAVTANTRLIVDSSKSAPELLLALRTFDLGLDVLHVVRDPRAVAYSQSRRPATVQPVSRWTAERVLTSSTRWAVRNTLLETIRARYASSQYRMRYEDFVTRTEPELRSLDRFLDTASIADQLSKTNGEIAVGPRHALDGNGRVLRQISGVRLRLDEEWRSAMSSPKRIAASIPAFPLMLFYGYYRNTSHAD